MKLASSDLSELAELAIRAATEAGEMIAQSRPQEVEHKTAEGGGGASVASQVVTEIDRRSEDIILGILGPTIERFGLGLLTEERHDDGSRFVADSFWCIDPLDGTLPYVEGTAGYAVSISLVGRDGVPHLGVVYDPISGTLSHAVSGVGAFRDRLPWRSDAAAEGTSLSVFADRSFLQRDDHDDLTLALDQIARDMSCSGVLLDASGGAVMNACAVLEHAPACYFKLPGVKGGGSLWDFAATSCLFHEVGAVATDIYGDLLDLNRPDSSYMNHRGVLFATDEVLAARLRNLHASAV